MIIICEATMDLFRAGGTCEVCFERYPSRDPAHIRARGQGSARRIDLPFNLVALCRLCHTKQHNGDLDVPEGYEDARDYLTHIAARRERLRPGNVTLIMDALIRLPSDASEARCTEVWREVREYSRPAAGLLRAILKAQGMLSVRICK